MLVLVKSLTRSKKSGNRKVVLKANRNPSKKIHTPTKAKKTPKKKNYVFVNRESASKKWNVSHHKIMTLEKEHYVEVLEYNKIMKPLSDA